MIVDKINAYLHKNEGCVNDEMLEQISNASKHIFSRQFLDKTEIRRELSLSSIGKCRRQNAYKILGFEEAGKSIDARGKMVFFQGDMAELAIVFLAKIAGVNINSFSTQQQEVSINGVIGHPDGIVIDNEKKYLLEVKSMTSYGFSDFEKGEIDESYLYQINSYLEALKLNECIMVALNKDSGVLSERIIKRDERIISDIYERLKLLKNSSKENLPNRDYQKNEKGQYPWQCLYCAFHVTCLPNAEKVLVSNKYKLVEKGGAK